MKAIIENDKITIYNHSAEFKQYLSDILSYTDKSKEYQIRKMEKNPYRRHSAELKQMKAEMHGTLLSEVNNTLVIPSGFVHLLKDIEIEDKRVVTGPDIALPWINKPYDARDYQSEAVSLMENNYRGLINFATGLGKTLTAVHLIRKTKKRTLVVCPGKSIADNFYAELVSAFGESKVGYFGDGKKKIKDITVGIVGSINNGIEQFKKHELGLIVLDECHHMAANTFFSITTALGNVGKIFGLTATDFRSDGKDVMITAGVGPVLIKRDLIWGIKNKWLADPYFVIRGIDTTGNQYKDDKLKNYKEHVLKSKDMNDRIIADVNKFLASGMSVLCLVDQIEHGDIIAKACGLNLATGEDKRSKDYINDLNNGTVPGLVGTDSLIGEGCDTKRVDVLVLANFTASKGPLWQNLGRGMRLYGNKTQVIVLDYCPNGSDMLKRHCKQRIDLYKEITSNIRIINV